MAEMTYIRAVNESLRASLQADERVVIFGEDIAAPNGPFGATKGLHRDFGDRVIDTPISEAGFTGMAVGAAMRGLRPIVEIMYMDFTMVAMDQIVNQLANTRYINEGRAVAPVVIRTQQGLSPGSCAQHSQSLEAVFAHIPGLRVGLPATPAEAFSMLRSAVACDDPVIIIEHRMLYPVKGDVDVSAPVAPVGGLVVRRPGTDLTVCAWSGMVPQAMRAADELAARGVDAEVLDLRWLNPLDIEGICDSVRRTRRAIVVHEAVRTGGFGAEVSSRIHEELNGEVVAAVVRLGALDVPIPSAPSLQQVVVPRADEIVEAALRLAAVR